MSGSVRLAVADGIARVTIRHPGKLNAMSRAMWRELRGVFVQIQQDYSLRAVALKGPQHFCAGGDISEYASFRFAYRYASSDEHREGVLAFTERRTPQFAC